MLDPDKAISTLKECSKLKAITIEAMPDGYCVGYVDWDAGRITGEAIAPTLEQAIELFAEKLFKRT